MDKPTLLRLVDPASETASASEPGTRELLGQVCQAFTSALGYRLVYAASPEGLEDLRPLWSAPVEPGAQATLGLAGPVPDSHGDRQPNAETAVALAQSIADLWSEVCALRTALAEREAELACDVPVVLPSEPARARASASAAERLRAVLKAGAESVSCQAAGLYLLDSGTTSLKLRACWGLNERKLAAPPRPLRGALADLEALLGHAVVLSEPGMFEYWRAPESCGAAVCVPVSSATTPLGTLWVYSHATRDFTDRETNLLEVVAGRLAADLEREVLAGAARHSQSERRQLSIVGERQADALPRIAPLVEGWSVAGRSLLPEATTGSFFDWFAADGERLAITLGAAVDRDLPAVVTAAELRSALRAQAENFEQCEPALRRAHDALAAVSAGGPGCSAFCGLLDPQSDVLRFATAGNLRTVLLKPNGLRVQNEISQPLGTPERPSLAEITGRLNRATPLVVYTLGGGQLEPEAYEAIEKAIWRALSSKLKQSADRLAEAAVAALRAQLPADLSQRGGALLVVRRS